jgi:hypothetical protein
MEDHSRPFEYADLQAIVDRVNDARAAARSKEAVSTMPEFTTDSAHTVRNLLQIAVSAIEMGRSEQALEALRNASIAIGLPSAPWVGTRRKWLLEHGFDLSLEVMPSDVTTVKISHESEPVVGVTIRLPNKVTQEIAGVMLVYCQQLALNKPAA